MQKKVTFVELSLYERIVPLVSGYLQSYACLDDNVRSSYSFEQYCTTIQTDRAALLRHLLRANSDVFAFSCYVWNTGLIKSILPPLLEGRPDAQFILGGPQVMHHAHKYLYPRYENLVICNGEGERTFRDYLNVLTEERPDFSKVLGLSSYHGGELSTTDGQERLHDLDQVPSPFLTGLFPGEYSVSILETNRGCPFHCGFCYWGAATNDKVAKFDEERIKQEITWLSQRGVMFFYIADANWGMLKRDIDLTSHMGDCTERFQAPKMVYFSAAKNKPESVTKIIEILKGSGVVISQPISLQTLSETSLAEIQRQNIKQKAYADLQRSLNEKHINSFTELIWPLPGETLASFEAGIDQLCKAGADTIIAYPHLLLHNTPLYKKQEEFGLVTRFVGSGAGEDEVVIETRDVSRDDFEEGMRFFYAMHFLHNGRSLFKLSEYLDRCGVRSFGELFSDFVEFSRGSSNALVRFWEASIAKGEFSDLFNYGKSIHVGLHSHRSESDDLLFQFASAQPWWSDAQAQFLFEIDLLIRPYVYSNTPMFSQDEARRLLKHLQLRESFDRSHSFEIPSQFLATFREYCALEVAAGDLVQVDHARMQYPFMEAQGLDHNAGYCHGMIIRIENILPAVAPAAVPVS